ncbi:acetyl-CoA carboxylase, carboxyltransferase subunit beta [Candidatus Methylacidithermus pantelleriae]|uniref:Acetyl-coenzyme A carboxylase carboxyl transferase subunit beta n=1 Tax=Candidatus Methylacidithermus pantelleriae TaxID=2744239 RepID=A0A8J2BLI7_9BACT|nr:acetyl-CoA carboxylase, carboxyltransferase subunit beta [Candidatus Methylacidithermus pantelleriae]CAF0703220.1 acetyl-CoA carboxyltransferase subunit beta [Candidatus Methylacidithermus pantelleriae]
MKDPEPQEALAPSRNSRKIHIPAGLWTKCPSCSELLYTKELIENHKVCKRCGYHFPMTAWERVGLLLDPGSFVEDPKGLLSCDPLQFHAATSYQERLAYYRKTTGLEEAVICGVGRIEGKRVAFASMDFGFLGGSMGSVVGEKITRLIERADREELPLVIVAASGGARMYEGILSLMQMAKTAGALARYSRKRLPYISVLTNPTMAGVLASFASLGDVLLAEPQAMIGFAGTRVIREAAGQELPKGFQTAEFLKDHGLVDRIVPRQELRETLAKLLDYLVPGCRSRT